MDTAREIARLLRGRRGIVIVIVAGCMVLILFFMGLAIDLSFRHVARTELQNAAEAAALAGATRLPDLPAARSAAVQYAALHKAAGSDVRIVAGTDVAIGNYDPNRAVGLPFVAGGTPSNAVQVQTRRTEQSAAPEAQGKVDLFFSSLFGYPDIAVSGTATAQRIPRASGYFVLSPSICTSGLPSPQVARLQAPAARTEVALAPGNNNMAWTAFTQVVSGSQISQYICQELVPDQEVGPETVPTSNGTVAQIFRDMEGTFFDHNYDATYKTFRGDGSVDTWTVIVPISNEGDPTTCSDHLCGLYGYAEILLTRACGTGAGRPCRDNRAPGGRCSGSNIYIGGITCVTYENKAQLLGRKAYLVKNNGE